MSAILSRLFSPAPETISVHALYIATVTQSRNPFFYTSLGVPDTLDGRFEMIVLHLFVVTHRLRRAEGAEAETSIRVLSEALFDDMDRNLREMGVGDTGVGKRIRQMADAFYGRLRAYEAALEDASALRDALRRNVYGAVDVAEAPLEELAEYVRRAVALEPYDAWPEMVE